MMSDAPDPILHHLAQRRATLLAEIREREARLMELEELVATLADGRTSLAKRRKGGNSVAPGDLPLDPGGPAREAADAGAVT